MVEACCPWLFGYLLPPLSLENTVAASARMLSLKESAAGGRSSLWEPHCTPVAKLYIVLVLRVLDDFILRGLDARSAGASIVQRGSGASALLPKSRRQQGFHPQLSTEDAARAKWESGPLRRFWGHAPGFLPTGDLFVFLFAQTLIFVRAAWTAKGRAASSAARATATNT